jgi:hypothetical protein
MMMPNTISQRTGERFMKSLKQSAAALAVLGLLLLPTPGAALQQEGVQTQATASNASAGESGASVGASALIGVLVLDGGLPVSSLGASVGNGTSQITLPTGWTLTTRIVPPGGCVMTPTEFQNFGGGLYSIRVVPLVTNASCRWLSGDYLYAVRIDTMGFAGGGLGKLTIK